MRRSWGCMKCYPKMCSCPLSKEQRIDALILCLASGLWNDNELYQFRQHLKELVPFNEKRIGILHAACISKDYSVLEQQRLKKQIELENNNVSKITD